MNKKGLIPETITSIPALFALLIIIVVFFGFFSYFISIRGQEKIDSRLKVVEREREIAEVLAQTLDSPTSLKSAGEEIDFGENLENKICKWIYCFEKNSLLCPSSNYDFEFEVEKMKGEIRQGFVDVFNLRQKELFGLFVTINYKPKGSVLDNVLVSLGDFNQVEIFNSQKIVFCLEDKQAEVNLAFAKRGD